MNIDDFSVSSLLADDQKWEEERLKEALTRLLGRMPALDEVKQHCVRETFTEFDVSFYIWDGAPFLAVARVPPVPLKLKLNEDGIFEVPLTWGWRCRSLYMGPLPEGLDWYRLDRRGLAETMAHLSAR